jgi:uncharacterized Zn finger protein (UPF0148 family)
MTHHCPNCKKVLYNRRLTHCGFCGAQISESLRFTPEEVAVINRKTAGFEEQRKHRERAKEAERQADGGDVPIDFSSFA